MEKVRNMPGTLEFHCLIAAVVFITICSKSSFFYPINDWGDVDCYYTIGLGMLKGLVPYRDLYDQKGIVIFSLYAIANLISAKSFIGGYILEIISAFFFLYITMKIAELFCDIKKYTLSLCFIVAGSVYSSASICHGGSAEELLLPLFSYGLYLCTKQIVKKEIPSKKEMFVFGIFAGLIFFSKYTLCIYYLSMILIMIVDSAINKNLLTLLKRALLFVLGCILLCIPIILYFSYNNALSDLYTAYFYNNIFHYTPDDPLITFLFRTSTFFRKRNILDIILIALSFIYLIKENKKLLFFCHLLVFFTVFYMQFFVGYPQKYYGIPLYTLEAIGLCIIVELFKKVDLSRKKIFSVSVVVAMIALAFIFTNNKYMLFKTKEQTRQYILASKMEQYGYEDYHMLSYNNLDDGYYFATGKFPNFRAFIQDNLSFDDLKNEQNELINNRKVEFIVTKKILCDEKDYDVVLSKYGEDKKKDIVTFKDFQYELVDETEEFYEDEYFLIKLYKIKD
jgi:hypothetical protein